MTQHPYVRAYLAGICVPTVFLLVVATGFIFLRYVYDIPVPVERVIVFPMAVVPNAWGLWNVLFRATHAGTRLSLGLHGAILPLLLAPLGLAATRILHFSLPHLAGHVFVFAGPIALVIYYLAWKFLVGSLNVELGID